MNAPSQPLPPEMPPPERPADMSVPCSVCREPIRPRARICIHCKSALDWRGWLGVSQTTLALLVALVSVVSASGPRIAELLATNYSETALDVRQVNHQFLEVEARNQGNRNSQILSATILAKTKDGKELEPIELEVDNPPSVFPGQQALFSFTIPIPEVPRFLALPHKEIDSAIVKARVAEFSKTPDDRTIELPIGKFRLFCRATEDADYLLRHPGQPLGPGQPVVVPGQPASLPVDQRLTTHCL